MSPSVRRTIPDLSVTFRSGVLKSSSDESLWLPPFSRETATGIRVPPLGRFFSPETSSVLFSLSLLEYGTVKGIFEFGLSGESHILPAFEFFGDDISPVGAKCSS